MSTKFLEGDTVLIKAYRDDPYNRVGIVRSVIVSESDRKVRYWVANLNMPFCGDISDFFLENELEKVEQ